MNISRRALAQLALASAASTQSTPAQSTPQASSDLLEQAKKQVEANSQLLRAQEIPMATEPAFQFKA